MTHVYEAQSFSRRQSSSNEGIPFALPFPMRNLMNDINHLRHQLPSLISHGIKPGLPTAAINKVLAFSDDVAYVEWRYEYDMIYSDGESRDEPPIIVSNSSML